eukprot:1182041-Prorocentrum_minimum.AAC.1
MPVTGAANTAYIVPILISSLPFGWKGEHRNCNSNAQRLQWSSLHGWDTYQENRKRELCSLYPSSVRRVYEDSRFGKETTLPRVCIAATSNAESLGGTTIRRTPYSDCTCANSSACNSRRTAIAGSIRSRWSLSTGGVHRYFTYAMLLGQRVGPRVARDPWTEGTGRGLLGAVDLGLGGDTGSRPGGGVLKVGGPEDSRGPSGRTWNSFRST